VSRNRRICAFDRADAARKADLASDAIIAQGIAAR